MVRMLLCGHTIMAHKISYFVLTFGLSGAAACAAFHDGAKRGSDDVSDDDGKDDVAGDGDTNDDVAQDPVQEDTPVPRPVCPEALPSTTPVELATDIQTWSVKLGPCGQLAFTDAQKNLHLLDATYTRELLTPGPGSALEFSQDGVLFLGSGDGNVRLQDLVSGESLTISGSQAGFLLEDESWADATEQPKNVAFVKDELGTGLVRNGKIESRLGPADGYVMAWSKGGARVLVEAADHTMRVLDFAHGSESAPELALVGGQGEFSGHDVIELSTDGKLLFHVAVDDEACGDTVCTHADTATVLELGQANRKHSLPASAEYDIELIDRSPYLALMGPTGLTLLDTTAQLETAGHPGYEALAVLPTRRQALAIQRESTALALIDFGTKGKVTPLAAASLVDGPHTSYVGISRAGSAIAFARPPTKCLPSQENPAGCQTQIWELDVWAAGKGVIHTYYSSQPMEAAWVGEDGSVLLAGDLIRELPAFAEPEFRGDYGLHLLGPDGKERVSLPLTVKSVIEREHDLVLVTSDAAQTTLALLDRNTGSLRELDKLENTDSGLPWFDLYLDDAQKRLVYVKNWRDAESVSRNSLNAVALP